ncbi:integrase core domain-containing protein [Streptomyces sp. NPDC004721]
MSQSFLQPEQQRRIGALVLLELRGRFAPYGRRTRCDSHLRLFSAITNSDGIQLPEKRSRPASGLARRKNFDQAEQAIFQWATWYSEERLHSALDYLPPAEYEHDYCRKSEQAPRSA